ncbi:hypothetical protein L596_012411 [Steinernema carpocapsae]|uniref:Uncharacterized protein n=1 Tax=Steinernema carpocapsae TaxID=34508 RepID=A0A4U5NXC9_STECR|nr:hypothetical protein L596_012411 [Steinernema carpocapsae]
MDFENQLPEGVTATISTPFWANFDASMEENVIFSYTRETALSNDKQTFLASAFTVSVNSTENVLAFIYYISSNGKLSDSGECQIREDLLKETVGTIVNDPLSANGLFETLITNPKYQVMIQFNVNGYNPDCFNVTFGVNYSDKDPSDLQAYEQFQRYCAKEIEVKIEPRMGIDSCGKAEDQVMINYSVEEYKATTTTSSSTTPSTFSSSFKSSSSVTPSPSTQCPSGFTSINIKTPGIYFPSQGKSFVYVGSSCLYVSGVNEKLEAFQRINFTGIDYEKYTCASWSAADFKIVKGRFEFLASFCFPDWIYFVEIESNEILNGNPDSKDWRSLIFLFLDAHVAQESSCDKLGSVGGNVHSHVQDGIYSIASATSDCPIHVLAPTNINRDNGGPCPSIVLMFETNAFVTLTPLPKNVTAAVSTPYWANDKVHINENVFFQFTQETASQYYKFDISLSAVIIRVDSNSWSSAMVNNFLGVSSGSGGTDSDSDSEDCVIDTMTEDEPLGTIVSDPLSSYGLFKTFYPDDPHLVIHFNVSDYNRDCFDVILNVTDQAGNTEEIKVKRSFDVPSPRKIDLKIQPKKSIDECANVNYQVKISYNATKMQTTRSTASSASSSTSKSTVSSQQCPSTLNPINMETPGIYFPSQGKSIVHVGSTCLFVSGINAKLEAFQSTLFTGVDLDGTQCSTWTSASFKIKKGNAEFLAKFCFPGWVSYVEIDSKEVLNGVPDSKDWRSLVFLFLSAEQVKNAVCESLGPVGGNVYSNVEVNEFMLGSASADCPLHVLSATNQIDDHYGGPCPSVALGFKKVYGLTVDPLPEDVTATVSSPYWADNKVHINENVILEITQETEYWLSFAADLNAVTIRVNSSLTDMVSSFVIVAPGSNELDDEVRYCVENAFIQDKSFGTIVSDPLSRYGLYEIFSLDIDSPLQYILHFTVNDYSRDCFDVSLNVTDIFGNRTEIQVKPNFEVLLFWEVDLLIEPKKSFDECASLEDQVRISYSATLVGLMSSTSTSSTETLASSTSSSSLSTSTSSSQSTSTFTSQAAPSSTLSQSPSPTSTASLSVTSATTTSTRPFLHTCPPTDDVTIMVTPGIYLPTNGNSLLSVFNPCLFVGGIASEFEAFQKITYIGITQDDQTCSHYTSADFEVKKGNKNFLARLCFPDWVSNVAITDNGALEGITPNSKKWRSLLFLFLDNSKMNGTCGKQGQLGGNVHSDLFDFPTSVSASDECPAHILTPTDEPGFETSGSSCPEVSFTLTNQDNSLQPLPDNVTATISGTYWADANVFMNEDKVFSYTKVTAPFSDNQNFIRSAFIVRVDSFEMVDSFLNFFSSNSEVSALGQCTVEDVFDDKDVGVISHDPLSSHGLLEKLTPGFDFLEPLVHFKVNEYDEDCFDVTFNVTYMDGSNKIMKPQPSFDISLPKEIDVTIIMNLPIDSCASFDKTKVKINYQAYDQEDPSTIQPITTTTTTSTTLLTSMSNPACPSVTNKITVMAPTTFIPSSGRIFISAPNMCLFVGGTNSQLEAFGNMTLLGINEDGSCSSFRLTDFQLTQGNVAFLASFCLPEKLSYLMIDDNDALDSITLGSKRWRSLIFLFMDNAKVTNDCAKFGKHGGNVFCKDDFILASTSQDCPVYILVPTDEAIDEAPSPCPKVQFYLTKYVITGLTPLPENVTATISSISYIDSLISMDKADLFSFTLA